MTCAGGDPGGLRQHLRRGALLHDAGVLTTAEAAVAVITVAQGLLLARWLGPSRYGLVALVTAVPATVLALLSPDSVHATVRYLAQREAAGDPRGALGVIRLATGVDAAVGMATLVLVAASSPLVVHRVLHGEASGWLVVVAAAGMALAAPAEATGAVLFHARRFHFAAILRVAGSLVRAVLMVGLVAAGHGVAGAVAGGAIASAAGALATVLLGSREARRRWGGRWTAASTADLREHRREMLRFLAWTDLGGLLGTATKQLDVVIVGSVAGTAAAGAYRLARSLAGLVGHVVGPLQTAAYPRLAHGWAAAVDLSGHLRRHVRLGAALGAVTLAGIVVAGPAIRVLAGEAYAPAVPTARLLIASSAVWAGLYWLRPLYMAAGEIRFWVGISAVTVAGSVVAFGPAGAAWGAAGVAGVQLAATVGGHAVAVGRIANLLARQRAETAGRVAA